LDLNEIREQRADKQKWDHPPAEQKDQGKAQSSARIPWRDVEMRIRLDKANPIEQHISHQIADANDAGG
jgi:hypothetical protein